jgi:hypothetical protein
VVRTLTGNGVVSGTTVTEDVGCEWYLLLQEMWFCVVRTVRGAEIVSGTYCYRGWGCEWYILQVAVFRLED